MKRSFRVFALLLTCSLLCTLLPAARAGAAAPTPPSWCRLEEYVVFEAVSYTHLDVYKRQHQHLVSPDDGGHAALVLGEVLAAAVNRALGAEQIMKNLIEAAARVTDEGGRAGHHLLHREVPEDLNAVHGDRAGRKEIDIGEENPRAAPGTHHAVPPGDGRAALGEALAQSIPCLLYTSKLGERRYHSAAQSFH